MLLYHFPTSPFARRVRLTLALKGLSAELRDARANPEHASDVRRLNPLGTVPMLVDGERVIGDSSAINAYLDHKAPDPPLWPAGLAGVEASELCALADGAIQVLVDLGMRYQALADHPGFARVREEYVAGRVQRTLDRLSEKVAARAHRPFLYDDRWSGADIAVFTTVAWLDGLPARAAKFPAAKQVLDLGWTLPDPLREWAARHRERDDVRALG